jgi:hypothetical protein
LESNRNLHPVTHVPPGKDKASLTPVTQRIASLPSRKNDKVTSSSMPLFPQVLLFSLVPTSALVFPSGAATPRTPLFLADAKELRRSSSPRHHRLAAGGEETRRHNGWRAMAAHRRLVPRPHRESPPAHLVLVLVWFYSRYFMDGGYDADR